MRRLNGLAKTLAGALCFAAVGFFTVNVPTGPLTMEEGRELAGKTATIAWPGSVFVAGVARFVSFSDGPGRPQRLTYYYRNRSGEILRISFENADRLAVEVRQYETQDELDLKALKPLPTGVISYDVPLAKAEAAGGAEFREQQRSSLVRAILTWPNDRDAPVYVVTYGRTGGGELTLRQMCCVDAQSGDGIDALRPH